MAVGTTYLTTKLTLPVQPKSKGKNKSSVNASMNSMLWVSPLMTLWIGLTTPCGLSFYWTINNVLSFVQQKALNKTFKKEKAAP
ncbi:MAG TPA: hypothetical protein DD738_04430 [Ruminiclostridium sp.]|nr:hypothetical protein [Ruminiclostridium sp.]